MPLWVGVSTRAGPLLVLLGLLQVTGGANQNECEKVRGIIIKGVLMWGGGAICRPNMALWGLTEPTTAGGTAGLVKEPATAAVRGHGEPWPRHLRFAGSGPASWA
jgi:hypothetical protein